jgi:iron complex outermembrane receptor protein
VINNVRLEDQEWGTEHAPNFDVNAAGKITVIKGASDYSLVVTQGGLIIIEPVSVKRHSFGKTILNLASNGRGGSMSSSLHKGNDKGWSWNALGTVIWETKKHPIMSCLTQGIEKLTFLAI